MRPYTAGAQAMCSKAKDRCFNLTLVVIFFFFFFCFFGIGGGSFVVLMAFSIHIKGFSTVSRFVQNQSDATGNDKKTRRF